MPPDSAARLITINRKLVRQLAGLTFGPPISHVYNPLVYAASLTDAYLTRFGATQKEVLFLGMNPGPFGMTQTGIPFGEVTFVREWMGLTGAVGQPLHPHPRRPVLGLDCPRSEVSGSRLWGWARDRFGPPEAFFAERFVANYCPLVFMEESGRNFTPDRLPAAERAPLFAACNAALRAVTDVLQPRYVIGVGAFATARAQEALAGTTITIGTILHPSPASPAANRGWAGAVDAQLRTLGIAIPTTTIA